MLYAAPWRRPIARRPTYPKRLAPIHHSSALHVPCHQPLCRAHDRRALPGILCLALLSAYRSIRQHMAVSLLARGT